MMIRIPRNIGFLSVAFSIIFFSFDGMQQYVTTFFDATGTKHVGFISLLLLYVAFTLGNPFAALMVVRLGAKRAMLCAVVFYMLYGLALASAFPVFLYSASILLGIAAAMLWIAQNSYLVRASDPNVYGAHAGFFSMLFAAGNTAGVFLFSIFLPMLGYTWGFLLFAFVPLFAFSPLLKLDDLRGEVRRHMWKDIRGALTSPTALRMTALWFSFNFIHGLMFGVIPLEIKKTIGVWAIGILGAAFYVMPILIAYLFGKLSDRTGRWKMATMVYILSAVGVGFLFRSDVMALLVIAVFLFALNFGIARTITFALIGDITTEENVEMITALTWLVQGIAFITALLLPLFLAGHFLYGVAFGVIIVSYFFLAPLQRFSLSEVRQRIASEMRSA